MFDRARVGVFSGVVVTAIAVAPLEAQIQGHVVIDGGPIGVSVVFGSRAPAVIEHRGVLRRPVRVPARYQPGMSRAELEHYLERIEYEYHYYRRISRHDAYLLFGWSEHQLEDYVHWLKDERRYLKNERKQFDRARREWRRQEREWERGHRGRGRGRGH